MDREKNSLAFKLKVPSSSCVATEDTLVIYSSTYKELPNFVIFPIENKENVKKGSPQKFPGQWQARGKGLRLPHEQWYHGYGTWWLREQRPSASPPRGHRFHSPPGDVPKLGIFPSLSLSQR